MALSSGPFAVGGATAAPGKQTLASNYIDFASGTGVDWTQQYLPELMEKEAEIFGNRTIGGFLSQVGAEEAMASDQVIWSEQGRLHLTYTNVTGAADTASGGTGTFDLGTDGIELTLAGAKDVDGVAVANSGVDHGIRVGDMLLIADADAVVQGFVQAISGAILAVERYDGHTTAMTNLSTSSEALTVMVYGSEYVKGAIGRDGANKPNFKSRTNKPIIIKDKYEVSGSDAAQIGWVEVSGEEGQNGYMWYLKASGDTKARFSDYLEMAMLESVKAGSGMDDSIVTGATGALGGTEGLFEAIRNRGHVYASASALADFDAILKLLDAQGAIEENMVFADRTLSLAMDDFLGAIGGGYATGGAAGIGASFGVFDNDKDMALNLGFSGFRRGSYDFYKSDWKYLNDAGSRGAINSAMSTSGAYQGVLIPAGVSSVYDQSLGKNLKRPFLHVRYRASNMESRKYKTWTTGSVGATTSDLDAMEMHFLSERCLVTQGANNFVLFTT